MHALFPSYNCLSGAYERKKEYVYFYILQNIWPVKKIEATIIQTQQQKPAMNNVLYCLHDVKDGPFPPHSRTITK